VHEDCAVTDWQGGGWRDEPCTGSFACVCERDAKVGATAGTGSARRRLLVGLACFPREQSARIAAKLCAHNAAVV
jgi:hypothetical protein